MNYWAIAEHDIEIQNPITDRKLRQLDDYCDIRDGLRVLDVGCGKAWVLRQWADKHEIEGVGLELNPRFLEVARRKKPAKGTLTFVEGPAKNFRAQAQSFDIVMCLGATFALDGFVSAVEWMTKLAKPGGAVVVGDLTLKHRPHVHRNEWLPNDPLETMAVVERHGAEVSAMISASDADFERYVSHHRHAALRWAREHPDHPDVDDVLEKSHVDWTYYLKTIRPYLGWTIFVGRNRG
jgi:SAM-dependent methyltransferase